MTTHTVGTFLREKMNNMAKWVHDEVGKENLGVDLVDFVAKKTDSELVYLAGLLKTKEDGIEKESFASQLVASVLLAYATYITYTCPCDRLNGCHLPQYLMSVLAATFIVVTENGGVVRTLQRATGARGA